MGTRRKAGDSSRLLAPSRRDVIGAAALAPVVSSARVCPPSDDLVARCAAWLALDLEIDRLSLRWSELETEAVREFGWFNLTRAQRRRVPMAREMGEIDHRLTDLFKARKSGLAALKRIKPTDIHGAASKLVVAARLSLCGGEDVNGFIAEAVGALATLKCPCCGAPYAPATPHRA